MTTNSNIKIQTAMRQSSLISIMYNLSDMKKYSASILSKREDKSKPAKGEQKQTSVLAGRIMRILLFVFLVFSQRSFGQTTLANFSLESNVSPDAGSIGYTSSAL